MRVGAFILTIAAGMVSPPPRLSGE